MGNVRDRTSQAARPEPAPLPPIGEVPKLLGVEDGPEWIAARPSQALDARIKIAGFGGQGVLMLGEVLAEAGLEAGYQVSWLPSYGPEMRSGTSHCQVRLSSHAIDSPLVSRPNVLLALNEPSLRKFVSAVEPGGIVLYNSAVPPEDGVREDLCVVMVPFTRIADELGSPKVANIVMLGSLLEATALLGQEHIASALRKLMKDRKWFELGLAALARGREAVRQGGVV